MCLHGVWVGVGVAGGGWSEESAESRWVVVALVSVLRSSGVHEQGMKKSGCAMAAANDASNVWLFVGFHDALRIWYLYVCHSVCFWCSPMFASRWCSSAGESRR